MRKILKEFDRIWSTADKANKTGGYRFHRCFSQRGKYVSFGIYDSRAKHYVLFDTINLVGNFRYNSNNVPTELIAMREMIDNR